MSSPPFPFAEPIRSLSERRHGPAGYENYQSYKQWLRDEHDFRCVYCLAREAWDATGPADATTFGADHLQAKSNSPGLVTNYENLSYCCNRCNPRKNAVSLPTSLIEKPLSEHLEITASGDVTAKTPDGEWLKDLLLLDDPTRKEWRKIILELHVLAQRNLLEGRSSRIVRLFAYPPDLPNLSTARPPSNSRPEGINESAFARRERGELPEFY